MKKIGEGYYYNVYEIDEGRVLKEIKSKFRIFIFILFANRFSILNSFREYKKATISILRLDKEYIFILSKIQNRRIIGNPKFNNTINYTQDKVRIISDWDLLNESEFSEAVTNYSSLLKKLWSYGISDSVFNFSINCGYDNKGEFILIDFNEMDYDFEFIKVKVDDKIWRKRSSYLFLTKEKKIIFDNIFDKLINSEDLKISWPNDSTHI